MQRSIAHTHVERGLHILQFRCIACSTLMNYRARVAEVTRGEDAAAHACARVVDHFGRPPACRSNFLIWTLGRRRKSSVPDAHTHSLCRRRVCMALSLEASRRCITFDVHTHTSAAAHKRFGDAASAASIPFNRLVCVCAAAPMLMLPVRGH